jgi:hypothetical protein
LEQAPPSLETVTEVEESSFGISRIVQRAHSHRPQRLPPPRQTRTRYFLEDIIYCELDALGYFGCLPPGSRTSASAATASGELTQCPPTTAWSTSTWVPPSHPEFNQIEKIENLEVFAKPPQLNLVYNLIGTIEHLSHLQALRVLRLTKNRIAKIENLEGLG